MPWRRAWQPTPVFLPGESQRQRSPAGYGPQGRIGSDVQLTLSLAGENRPHQPHLEPRLFSSQEAAPPRALRCPCGVLGRQHWRQGGGTFRVQPGVNLERELCVPPPLSAFLLRSNQILGSNCTVWAYCRYYLLTSAQQAAYEIC